MIMSPADLSWGKINNTALALQQQLTACQAFVITYPTFGPHWTERFCWYTVYTTFTSMIWQNTKIVVNGITFILSYSLVCVFSYYFFFPILNGKKRSWIWWIKCDPNLDQQYLSIGVIMWRIMFLITDISIWFILFAWAWMDDLAVKTICECRLDLYVRLNL